MRYHQTYPLNLSDTIINIEDISARQEDGWSHIQDQLAEHWALIQFLLTWVGHITKQQLTTPLMSLVKKEDQMTQPLAILNVFAPPFMEPEYLSSPTIIVLSYMIIMLLLKEFSSRLGSAQFLIGLNLLLDFWISVLGYSLELLLLKFST